jgi:hypothetical protein
VSEHPHRHRDHGVAHDLDVFRATKAKPAKGATKASSSTRKSGRKAKVHVVAAVAVRG